MSDALSNAANSGDGTTNATERLTEGIGIIAVTGVVFDMWVAGYMVGDYIPEKVKLFVTYVLISTMFFGIYWSYLGWKDTHGFTGNTFSDTWNYFANGIENGR